MKPKTRVVTFSEALAMGPAPAGNLAVPVLARGSLEVEIYTPGADDMQQPHTRDEIYVVARGEAWFFDGEHRRRVVPGTFVFVAAGQVHRFEDVSDDFAVWVAFYGPEGGEDSER